MNLYVNVTDILNYRMNNSTQLVGERFFIDAPTLFVRVSIRLGFSSELWHGSFDVSLAIDCTSYLKYLKIEPARPTLDADSDSTCSVEPNHFQKPLY